MLGTRVPHFLPSRKFGTVVVPYLHQFAAKSTIPSIINCTVWHMPAGLRNLCFTFCQLSRTEYASLSARAATNSKFKNRIAGNDAEVFQTKFLSNKIQVDLLNVGQCEWPLRRFLVVYLEAESENSVFVPEFVVKTAPEAKKCLLGMSFVHM